MYRQLTIASLACLLIAVVGCSGESNIDLVKENPPVNGAVQVAPSAPTQIAAADALGRIGQPAVPALIETLSDANPEVRLQACRALTYMGVKGVNAVPALMQRINDQSEVEAVRIQAANALGQIGDAAQPAVGPLLQMMRSGK
ncbi:MAG TPA: HEAT repeat domain-containing protein [Pirellulales bacterium]